jgi:hypothetical protein
LTHPLDIDAHTVREGEFVCNSLIDFNFGDGHLHNAEMVQAVQREADLEPATPPAARRRGGRSDEKERRR